jgi:hypothetical protein
MQSISKSGNIHEQAKAMMGKTAKDPSQHDFFAPLNEMDPLTRRKPKIALPKFNFYVFYLSGSDSLIVEEDTRKYMDVMRKVTEGEFQLLDENQYHTKDGEIKVFLKWLELPTGKKEEANEKSFEKAFDAVIEGKKTKSRKPRKRKKKTPGSDPEITM